MAGRGTWTENLRLDMVRNGVVEKTFWTFSYSPLYDDKGEIAGPMRHSSRAERGRTSAAERVTIDGSNVSLTPQQGLGLALAVHELSTNAVKFGARSTRQGRVSIGWTLSQHGEFRFEWVELDGPAVQQPKRQGFGSRLTTRVVPTYFDGRATVEFRSEGVVYRLSGRLGSDVQDRVRRKPVQGCPDGLASGWGPCTGQNGLSILRLVYAVDIVTRQACPVLGPSSANHADGPRGTSSGVV